MTDNDKIFLSPPHMDDNALTYIKQVFDSNYIAPLGEFVDRFERSIADYTKANSVLCVSSGTAAIHLALRVSGVGAGDEVLASSFTFIGSIAPILYQQAIPVFIDSDSSWQLSPDILQETLQQYTKHNKPLPKALIVTHLYGQMADMVRINQICQAHNIIVIEDAAEAMGSILHGKHAGLWGDFGIFSFNGNKMITTSGGGALVAKDSATIQRAKFFATTAKEEALHYEHQHYGYNYRLSNVLAAIGVGQMEVLAKRVQQRQNIFAWYQQQLQGLDIDFMPQIKGCMGNRWLSTIDLKQDYHPLIEALAKHNIEARPLWKPMHLQPLFSGAKAFVDGTSEKLFHQGVCLPSGSALALEQVAKISTIIQQAMHKQ